ncbi:hypothetical protein EMCRGX_G032722 [Ephydatia muelleri]
MNARHVATLQTALRTKVPVSAGTYEGNVIVASSGTGDARNICVWYVFAEDKQVLTLKGHSSILKSLALSPPGPRCLLCSVAEDSAILWDIGECYSRNSAAKMQQQVVLTSLSKETAGSASFNDTSSLVAVCRGCDVLVFTTKLCQLDTTLVGHSAPVTGAVFSTRHSNLIITISEDRTFKIWDLVQSSVAFQSAIISASVFVSACMDPVQDHLFTMAADGKLRVYDMVLGNGHAKLQECDVGKEQEKMASHVHFEEGNTSNNDSVIRSMVSRQPPSDAAPSTNPCAHAGPLVIGMYYLQGKHGQEGDEELPGALPSVSVSSISQVLSVPSRLLVVTSLGALCLNANTLETLSYLDFRAGHTGHRAAGHRADRIAGHRGDRIAGHRGDRTAGHRGDRTAGHRADMTAGHRADRIGEIGQQAIGQIGQQAIGEIGQQAIGQIGQQAIGEIGQQAIGQIGQQAIGQIGQQAIGEIGQQAIGEIGQQAIGHIGQEGKLPTSFILPI